MDTSSEILASINEIRDLVRLLAEPAIAERDQKLRAELRNLVRNSAGKAKAVLLMDGSRTQAGIVKEAGVNQGHLSTLVKQMATSGLLSGDTKQPKLAITIPKNFFETGTNNE